MTRSLLSIFLSLSLGVGCGDDGGPAGRQLGADADGGAESGVDAGPDDADVEDISDGGDDVADAPDVSIDVPPPECRQGWQELELAGNELMLGETETLQMTECTPAQRFVVASAGAKLQLEVADAPPILRARVTQYGEAITELETGGTSTVSLFVEQTGEVTFRFDTRDGAVAQPRVTVTCLEGCDAEATRYPIVLMHGMAGTDEYIGLLEYFFGVPGHLNDAGYQAYNPAVEFIAPSSVRAETLREILDQLIAETGYTRFHLIGHSQGGLDMRVLASESGLDYGSHIATMTTVATPHGGIRLQVPQWLSGQDFSEEAMADFAADYPDVEAIPRFSWSAATCSRFDDECLTSYDGEEVDLLLAATYNLVRAAHQDDPYGGDNDGLVPRASAEWGEVLGVIPADHFDSVGQIGGNDGGPFDHLAFYLSEARRLRQVEIALGL